MATSITRTLLAVSSRRVFFRPRTLVSAADKTDAVAKKEKDTGDAVETVPVDQLVRKWPDMMKRLYYLYYDRPSCKR